MQAVRVYKIGDRWNYDANGHIERGFATRDEAQLAGEKFLVEKHKAEARQQAEEQAVELEEEEELDEK
jgi:hypothetical protein